jgi:branched-chain amino acid transport system ATP-binding protein
MAVLEVEGLCKAYGGIDAVDDLGFRLDAGELLALIGPNGAGKTTCFNCLNGQVRPDAGSIRLAGRELVGLPPRRIWRLGVGRTFQITQTFGSMTVLENVQQALISHHRRARGGGRVPPGCIEARRWRCSSGSGSRTRPSAPARCWPMAI